MKTAPKKDKHHSERSTPVWDLCLYVEDGTPRSLLAAENLKRICGERLRGRFRITVVDVFARPEAARAENIVAVPTLVRRNPKPKLTVIGALSNVERVVRGLRMRALPATR